MPNAADAARIQEPQRAGLLQRLAAVRWRTINARHARGELWRWRVHPRHSLLELVRHRVAPLEGRRGRAVAHSARSAILASRIPPRAFASGAPCTCRRALEPCARSSRRTRGRSKSYGALGSVFNMRSSSCSRGVGVIRWRPVLPRPPPAQADTFSLSQPVRRGAKLKSVIVLVRPLNSVGPAFESLIPTAVPPSIDTSGVRSQKESS
jgi:hypothetical protein